MTDRKIIYHPCGAAPTYSTFFGYNQTYNKKIKYLELFSAWNMLGFSDYFYMKMFSY